MADHLVGRFLSKCSTVGTNYQPSHQVSTSVSTCSVWTGNKHKTGSANYVATITTAAALLRLSLFGSSVCCSLRCPTARHMWHRSSLFSADRYLFTYVSVQRIGPIFKFQVSTVKSKKRAKISYTSRQKPEITHLSTHFSESVHFLSVTSWIHHSIKYHIVVLFDLHWVRAFTVLMYLRHMDRPFVPHYLILAQDSPVHLPKFQMAPQTYNPNVVYTVHLHVKFFSKLFPEVGIT
jgi:hypothetical protein